MSAVDSLAPCDVDEMLKPSATYPDFVVDGIHFGRGDFYYNEETSTQLQHTTTELKCWRVVKENLEEIDDKLINCFYDSETYIIQWNSVTETFRFNTDEVLSTNENKVYFYWKGDAAPKGYSPLPESIEKDNPPVERITQWAEPPAFLYLFAGNFIVHNGKHNNFSDEPHLYIFRGEMFNETHLYEVPLKRESLRSRTAFVLFHPQENSSIIWYGSKASPRCRNFVKKIVTNLFGDNLTENTEGAENEKFSRTVLENGTTYFANPPEKVIDYTPRLFYLNNITGSFSATEIECCHKSTHLTPFPFLQSHLYTAGQPATFLVDDHDEIWIWQGWEKDEDKNFKSECFATTIQYAKKKSKILKKLVKVHKVIAGFEPISFTNLFPAWNAREDVVQMQVKEGVTPNPNSLIEEIPQE